MLSTPVLEFRPATPHPSKAESETAGNVVLMGNSALFAGLQPSECREIVSSSRTRVFAPQEVLFMQGHPVRTHILIQSGCVKVTQLSVTGREVLLWINGARQTVGIPTVAPSSSHACSARAMGRCHALTWEDSRFQSLMGKYPQIGANINRMLSLQLAELEQRFREIATEKVPTRLSLALNRLAVQLGKPIMGGVEVSLSREDLAQMIGTTLFTVSRILSKWADEGFIAPRRNGVIIYDSDQLLLAGADASELTA